MAQTRILVIDDDQNIRSTMQAILIRSGYRVETTPYLATAVGEALSGNFDLITLDLNMPGIDGREIARLFQKRAVKTPVLVISGFIDDASTKQLKNAGIKHFLAKPFDIADLPPAVEHALAG